MAVRRPSELTVSKKELRLIKKRQKIEKFRATCARDEMIERKRNIGIIRVRHGVDRVMLTLILVLLCLGTVMVFSASYPSAIAKYGDSLHYIKRQAIFALMGIGIMALVSFLPYQLFRKFAVPAYVLAMILLVLVLLFGVKDGEAKRWLGIPNSSLSIQPSEVMENRACARFGVVYGKIPRKHNRQGAYGTDACPRSYHTRITCGRGVRAYPA